MCRDGHAAMRATSPRRHVQHIFRDKETSRGREETTGGGRERDELFVVSCTLHPRTLTPRYPVYRVDPLPLTVSSIMSATSASDICTPLAFFFHERILLWSPGGTLLDVLSTRKLRSLPLSPVRIITARCIRMK